MGGCRPPRTKLSRLRGYRGFSPRRPAHTLVLLGAWGQAWRGGKAPLLSHRESVWRESRGSLEQRVKEQLEFTAFPQDHLFFLHVKSWQTGPKPGKLRLRGSALPPLIV